MAWCKTWTCHAHAFIITRRHTCMIKQCTMQPQDSTSGTALCTLKVPTRAVMLVALEWTATASQRSAALCVTHKYAYKQSKPQQGPKDTQSRRLYSSHHSARPRTAYTAPHAAHPSRHTHMLKAGRWWCASRASIAASAPGSAARSRRTCAAQPGTAPGRSPAPCRRYAQRYCAVPCDTTGPHRPCRCAHRGTRP